MKIYFAGAENKVNRKYISKVRGDALYSYHYHRQGRNIQYALKGDYDYNVTIFMDCGAYSAHTQGVEIDIDEYLAFCERCDADYFAALDDIGDYKKTLENLKYMEERASPELRKKIVPVYHRGEPEEVLQYYIKYYDYIALGGLVGDDERSLKAWFDVIFSRYPGVKFHGFGMTNINLMRRYPWFSVDSTTWNCGVRYGTIILPDGTLGRYRELIKKPVLKGKIKYLLEKHGLTHDDIMSDPYTLNTINLHAFKKIVEEKEHTEIKFKQTSLFGFEQKRKEEEDIVDLALRRIEELKKEYPGLTDEQLMKVYEHQNM